MTQIKFAAQYALAHWAAISSALLYLLMVLQNRHVGGDQIQTIWHVLSDLIGFSVQKNATARLVGTKMSMSSKVKIPLFMRSSHAEMPNLPPPPKVALLVPFLFMFIASCACNQPSHRNDVGCVVLHQVIDCSSDATFGSLAPTVVAIIKGFLGGNMSPDWNALLVTLEAAGVKDGGCILAQLINDFTPSAAPAVSPKSVATSNLVEFKAHFGIPDVKYCLTSAAGKVCL